VEEQWGFHVMLNDEIEPFIENGLIPGRYNVLLGREETDNWSGWAATGPILGMDGITLRWLYAFMFKPEQPTMNWMDPTYMDVSSVATRFPRYGYVSEFSLAERDRSRDNIATLAQEFHLNPWCRAF